MSDFQKAEIRFLMEVKNRGGLTVDEALSVQEENPQLKFGAGVDAIDIIDKFASLGFLKYERDTGKFIPAQV